MFQPTIHRHTEGLREGIQVRGWAGLTVVGLLLMPYNPTMTSKINITSRMNLKPNSPNTLGSGGKETKKILKRSVSLHRGDIYIY